MWSNFEDTLNDISQMQGQMCDPPICEIPRIMINKIVTKIWLTPLVSLSMNRMLDF